MKMKRYALEAIIRPDPEKWTIDKGDTSEMLSGIAVTARDAVEACRKAIHQAQAVDMLVSRFTAVHYTGKEVG